MPGRAFARASARAVTLAVLALALLAGCGDGRGLAGLSPFGNRAASPEGRMGAPVPVVFQAGPETPRPAARPAARPGLIAGDAAPAAGLPAAGAVASPAGSPPAGSPPAGSPPAGSLASGALGSTLASLGSPAEAGLWLRTGLVTQVMPGRVIAPDGRAQAVQLRPSGAAPGAGSQLSLEAFRALGLPLTQLVRLQVLAP